jgi:hypothetical protein
MLELTDFGRVNDLAVIVVFNRELSDDELRALEDYLKNFQGDPSK